MGSYFGQSHKSCEDMEIFKEGFMRKGMTRRKFLEIGTASAVGTALALNSSSQEAAQPEKAVRVGVVGTGNRGCALLNIMLQMKGVEFPALCDIKKENLERAQNMVVRSGRPKPEGYSKNEFAFEDLLDRDDIDAVIIATYWQWHAPMAVSAMKKGKYVGVEVPAAITVEECWDLVNTHEKTKVPCMMLENWSFRRDNLAVLNMIREGLFGEIVHCHCAHSHDCIDHWFFDPEGNIRWGGEFLLMRNCDQYPTHSLGPVISWMDINRGDNYDSLTSTATASKGINEYFRRKFGPDHPNAKQHYKQGDIVTTVVKTHKGRTIVINYDMQLPRPYDNRWLIQGTLGLYNEQRNSVYVTGKSPEYHQWEPFPPYEEKYEHAWWKKMREEGSQGGHGGTDTLELKLFIDAVRSRTQTPIDVYDSVSMSCIVGLSEQSIMQNSAPVKCPDFTRGRWKTWNPRFGLNA